MIHEIAFEPTEQENPTAQFHQWLQTNPHVELIRLAAVYRVRETDSPEKRQLARFLRQLDELS
ncbi:hypothetical protein [Brevibacillus sp. H7]|uniref:hypothetical protein n=1 Tax=Brevibacillus sp. H7 TaxID=3349138 RepID=UPI00380FA36A